MSNTLLFGQINVTGTVLDLKSKAVIGASVYIENTYDGDFTDEEGKFNFSTDETGKQVIVVSYISYKTKKISLDVNDMHNLTIKIKQEVNELNAVTITAGTFETGENSKTAVLDPIEVVTTAGAEAGDINSAIKTLPGIQTVGEDGRLFVRGGDASETKVFIDGMRVFKPYLTNNANMPTRSRFSSFLFKGVAFSSGGFSAEYGDALSGVLSMNTIDFPKQNQTDISLMSLGLGIGKTKILKNDAISLSLGYIDLGPYKSIFPDNFNWVKPYRGLSGESVYRHKYSSGMLKFYAGGTISDAIINRYNVDYDKNVDSQVKNNNVYVNTTYRGSINDHLATFAGASFSYDKSLFGLDKIKSKIEHMGMHAKVKLTHIISDKTNISYGPEVLVENLKSKLEEISSPEINSKTFAGYVEGKILFSEKFVTKIGLRAEYSQLLDKWNVAPRISLAYKTGKNSQISLATGKYFQLPDMNLISDNLLIFENTDQIILNYSYKTRKRILRTELYYKKYNDLIRYDSPQIINNTGYGYARGFDVFWKDKKSFKYLEYWVSYSLLDAKKIYKNYPEIVSPGSASKHNLSIVAKYWINSLRSYPGITYNYGSPRPYNNPNSSNFMSEKTKSYNNLSLTWSYLISQQKILFFSFSNILGYKNEYGYEYSANPDNTGKYRRNLITPPSTRSFFIGFFWTISDDNKANQIDRL